MTRVYFWKWPDVFARLKSYRKMISTKLNKVPKWMMKVMINCLTTSCLFTFHEGLILSNQMDKLTYVRSIKISSFARVYREKCNELDKMAVIYLLNLHEIKWRDIVYTKFITLFFGCLSIKTCLEAEQIFLWMIKNVS